MVARGDGYVAGRAADVVLAEAVVALAYAAMICECVSHALSPVQRGPKRESGGDGKPADKPAGEKPKGEATPAKPKAEAGNKQASGKKESAKKAA